MATETIAETLKKQRVLIFNSKKPEIAPKLAQYGVDSAYQTRGENLYNEVIALSETQKKEYQEESLAYDNSFAAANACKVKCTVNRRIIKMASRADSDLQNRIKINIPKERKIEAWIKQTLEFYNLVLNESSFLTSIARFGITAATLTADKNDLDSLKALRNEAMSEKGQAQEATRLRDLKMDELEDYCYELKTIAMIALEGQPQLLEMLGILVRS